MQINRPIIIVDDDDDDHYIFKRVCEKLGVTAPVHFFTDARKALEYLKSSQELPFLILSDVNMPVMNGLELKRQIEEDEVLRKKTIPFIFFSTSAMSSLVKDAYNMSAQGFFIKGHSLAEFEQTLKIIFEYWIRCEHPRT
jgi:CheY-like chemotaxis protein